MKDYVTLNGEKIFDNDLSFDDVPFFIESEHYKEKKNLDLELEKIKKENKNNDEDEDSSSDSSSDSGSKTTGNEIKNLKDEAFVLDPLWSLMDNKKYFGLSSKKLNLFIDLSKILTGQDLIMILSNLQNDGYSTLNKDQKNAFSFDSVLNSLHKVFKNYSTRGLKETLLNPELPIVWNNTNHIYNKLKINVKSDLKANKENIKEELENENLNNVDEYDLYISNLTLDPKEENIQENGSLKESNKDEKTSYYHDDKFENTLNNISTSNLSSNQQF